MESDAVYYLHSKLPGEPSLGVWYFPAQQGRVKDSQPIRLVADPIEWTAEPNIVGRGPTRLGVGPYRYTGEHIGELAIATHNEDDSRDWYLVPSDHEQYYLIVANPRSDLVWTVGETHEVKIAPYTGGDNQLFIFKLKPSVSEQESISRTTPSL